MAKAHFPENALSADKSVGARQTSARDTKGICKVVALKRVEGAILAMVAPERLAIFVE